MKGGSVWPKRSYRLFRRRHGRAGNCRKEPTSKFEPGRSTKKLTAMQPDSYRSLATSLAAVALTVQQQGPDQVVVSCQEGPVWPNRGNSFWLSRKEGAWYLSTWSPVGYGIPADQGIVALCIACMSVGNSAMYRVRPDLVSRFQLQELDDDTYQRLFL